MLDSLLQLINTCKRVYVDKGTVYCEKWTVSDKAIIQQLYDESCFEQTIFPDEIQDGQSISFELTAAKLCKFGFYDTCERFVSYNKYKLQNERFYIYEIKASNTDSFDSFVSRYKGIVEFVDALESISKHTFDVINVKNLLLSNEETSVALALDYSAVDIDSMSEEQLSKIISIIETIKGKKNEKRNLYINEIIEFVHKKNIDFLPSLLKEIFALHDNCENAYSFYISNYSSNKLKFEIDSKAIDFMQKIQSIINESQTKLIAIPSAFVLASISMEYDKFWLSISIKNVVTIISLFIFAILLQLFLSNQKNILEVIEQDVCDFKKSFQNIQLGTTKFKYVDDSVKKQKRRFKTISWILWGIPVLFLLYLIVSFFILKS